MAKNKISRKQLLKEPDEFLTFSGKMIQFAVTHRNQLTIAVVLVAAAVLIFSLISFFAGKAEKKAFALLGQANEKYESVMAKSQDPKETLKAVEPDFQIILDEFAGYRGGEIARVQFANISLEGGDHKRAAELFGKALKDFGNKPSYRNLILNGLAYSHEGAENYEKAAEYFKMIADGDFPVLKGTAWFNLARIYERMGKENQQQEALQKIVSDYPDSMYFELAKNILSG